MRTGFAFLNTTIYPLCKRNDSGDENMTKQMKKAPGGSYRRGLGVQIAGDKRTIPLSMIHSADALYPWLSGHKDTPRPHRNM